VLQQLRYRQRLVEDADDDSQQPGVHASSRGVSLRTQLKSRRGIERLQQIALPQPLIEQRAELCQLLQELKTRIARVEQWLEAKANSDIRAATIAYSLRHRPPDGSVFGAHAGMCGAFCQSAQGNGLCRF